MPFFCRGLYPPVVTTCAEPCTMTMLLPDSVLLIRRPNKTIRAIVNQPVLPAVAIIWTRDGNNLEKLNSELPVLYNRSTYRKLARTAQFERVFRIVTDPLFRCAKCEVRSRARPIEIARLAAAAMINRSHPRTNDFGTWPSAAAGTWTFPAPVTHTCTCVCPVIR